MPGHTVNRFVALLRGVNVGKGNKLPMAAFRDTLEGLGFSDVRTLLNSGNATFSTSLRSADELAGAIARSVETRFGVVTPVIVKSAAELEAIVRNVPFAVAESDHPRCIVAFTPDTAKLQQLQGLASLLRPGERFAVNQHAAYLHCPGGILQSKLGEALLGTGVQRITTRNWATVLKLLAQVREGAASPKR